MELAADLRAAAHPHHLGSPAAPPPPPHFMHILANSFGNLAVLLGVLT
jgi:hypothetical protein